MYIIVNTIKNLPLDPIKRASAKDIFEEVELFLTDDNVLARKLKKISFPEIYRRKIKDIGRHFGLGESGVSQAGRRVAQKIENDKQLKKKIAKISKKMNL